MSTDRFYSSREVAEILGIGLARVSVLARSRGIGRKIGRDWLFTAEDIEALKIRKPGRPSKK